MHDGKANSGPLDFFFLLKRRRVTFDRFCENEGITSREEFLAKVVQLESSGEFFVSEEMKQAGLELFPEPQETPPSKTKSEASPTGPSSSPDPAEAPEEPSTRKKRPRAV